MNLPKVIFHLSNWLYLSLATKWFGVVCAYYDFWIWYHRSRVSYLAKQIEKNDVRIVELEAELARRTNT